MSYHVFLSFTVQKVWCYTAPKILQDEVVADAGSVVMDNRCTQCVKAFPDVRGLLQHCAETGHQPVFDPKDSFTREAEPPVFLSYANMVLSRALSERLAKWGREYIDPGEFAMLSLNISDGFIFVLINVVLIS